MGKLDFAQPDVHYVGGVARALRVARMSMAANKTFVPHSPNPCMMDIFALSMLAAVPNAFGHMEFDAINTRSPPDGTTFFTQRVLASLRTSAFAHLLSTVRPREGGRGEGSSLALTEGQLAQY